MKRRLIFWLMITVILSVLLNVVAMPVARAENNQTSVAELLRPRRLLSMSVIQNEPDYIPAEMVATPPPEYNVQKFTNPGGSESPFALGETEQQSVFPSAGSLPKLTKRKGVNQGPSGKETWYNLNMSGVIKIMRRQGFSEEEYPYWIRDDGCKMFGDYIMIAANLELRPRGTVVETSLGPGIVCDTGGFTKKDTTGIDIATNW